MWKNDIEIEYGSAVSSKRIKFIGHDKGFISKDSILASLPQWNYEKGAYEFLDELKIGDFWLLLLVVVLLVLLFFH